MISLHVAIAAEEAKIQVTPAVAMQLLWKRGCH